ncbi:MAG: hypothetical protein QOI41_4335 [Myxococcales bacterium]|nr:hypothetical protein [Myxococcales bacterium]
MLSSRAPSRDPARGNAPGPASIVRARDFVNSPPPAQPITRSRPRPARRSNGARNPSRLGTVDATRQRWPAFALFTRDAATHSSSGWARAGRAWNTRSATPRSSKDNPSTEQANRVECVCRGTFDAWEADASDREQPCRTATHGRRDGRETCLTATCSGVQLNADTPSGTHMAPARPQGPDIPHPMLNTRQH